MNPRKTSKEKSTSKNANRASKEIVSQEEKHQILLKSDFLSAWRRKAPEKRTTFRISKEVNGGIERLSKEKGVSIKEVFRTICSLYEDKEILSIWASGLSEKEYERERDLSKTVSVDVSKLELLNKISKEYGVERDLLVEYGAHLIWDMWGTFKMTRETMYTFAHEKFGKILSELIEIEEKFRKMLSDDDPGLSRLGLIITAMENFSSALNNYIEERQEIDPEDI